MRTHCKNSSTRLSINCKHNYKFQYYARPKQRRNSISAARKKTNGMDLRGEKKEGSRVEVDKRTSEQSPPARAHSSSIMRLYRLRRFAMNFIIKYLSAKHYNSCYFSHSLLSPAALNHSSFPSYPNTGYNTTRDGRGAAPHS